MTFRELFTLFDRWNQDNRSPGTTDFYRFNFRKLLDALGDVEADQLKPHHLLQWRSTWHLV